MKISLKLLLRSIVFFIPLFYLLIRKSGGINVKIVKKFTDWCIDDPNIIDLYIMWVNGSDPKWFSRMKKTANERNLVFDDNYFVSRYQEHSELKWSLRSVEKHLPWIHKIHIVTDKQFPNWMNISHPKLHFVNHDFLFYPGYHSFNSHAIQYLMYKIPGISRRVIMTDDDMFFLQKIEPNYFFDELNRTIIHTHRYKYQPNDELPECHYQDTGEIYRYGIQLTHKVIYEKFNRTLPIKNSHLPNPMDMKTLFEIHQVFDIEPQIFLPFRLCGDYQFQTLVNLYSSITNRSIKTPYKPEGMVTYFPEQVLNFYSINSTIKLLCVNNYDSSFYEKYLPSKFLEKSSFEL